MQMGFNHNLMYKGVVYHVQTEDGGVGNPAVTTHLFIGGKTIATRKTSYADSVQSDNLDDFVRQIMKEQTMALLRELKSGALDDLLEKKA